MLSGAFGAAIVVGYQTKTIEAGFTLSTPTFIDVGESGCDIANFKLGPNAAGDGTEQIQVLNGSGIVTATYIWLNGNAGMADGWYDNDTWSPITEEIIPGQGFLMYCDAPVEMILAGQVKPDETEVTIPAGFSISGNCTPVTVKLQNMKLADTAAGDGTEQIQILNASGIVVATYIWLNSNAGMTDGWYDNDTWESIPDDAVAGEAYLMYADTETKMTIPSAL